MGGFEGRRVFLTGAASGIGRATALLLARDGAELFLTDVNAEGLQQTVADARALGAVVSEFRALDVSDYEAVAAFAADIHAGYPAMDAVMNIAGISAWGTVDQLTHGHWRSMVDVNLMGPIHVIRCFVPPMVAAGRAGRLVNVSSAAGLVALPWHAAYSASKYGLRGVSEVLAIRSGTPPDRCLPGGAGRWTHLGADRGHSRCRPERSAGCRWIARFSATPSRPSVPPRRSSPVSPRTSSHLHVTRHPCAVHVQTCCVVALQLRDDASERDLHASAATALIGGHSIGASSSRTPSSRTGCVSSKRSNTRRAVAVTTSASMLGWSSLRILVRV